MVIEPILPYLTVAICALIVGMGIARVVKYKGFKGARFGAFVGHTIGQISGRDVNFGSSVLRMHSLKNTAGQRLLCLEVVTKSIGSYESLYVKVSESDTRKLIDVLEAALAHRRNS